LLIVIVVSCHGQVCAQQSLIAMNVETSFTDTTVEGIPDVRPTTLFTTLMNVSVEEGANILKLHVKLGSTPGGSEFLSTSFDYNVPGTFGSTTYSQNGSNILLGLGAFMGMIHYYGQVQVETTSHSFETPLNFSR